MAVPRYTPDQQDFMRGLWDEELSAADIAVRFNARYHAAISRLAVIGLARRLGFDARKAGGKFSKEGHRKRVATMTQKGIAFGRTPYNHKTKPQVIPSSRPKAILAISLPAIPEPIAIGPLGDFPDAKSCRWPTGEGITFQCCGAAGFPYCEFHRAKAWVRPHPRGPRP